MHDLCTRPTKKALVPLGPSAEQCTPIKINNTYRFKNQSLKTIKTSLSTPKRELRTVLCLCKHSVECGAYVDAFQVIAINFYRSFGIVSSCWVRFYTTSNKIWWIRKSASKRNLFFHTMFLAPSFFSFGILVFLTNVYRTKLNRIQN